MDLTKLTYRFLIESELPKYIEFYDSVELMMKSPKFPRIRDNIISGFANPNRKHVGVFDENNNLVSTFTGWFPPTYPFWYGTFQQIQTGNTSLSSHIDFIEIFNKSIKVLTDYGEENGYYGFYVRRLLDHQKSHEKLLNIALKRNAISELRYNYLYEAVYGPMNTTTTMTNHKFFFPDGGDYGIDHATVIILFSLKQQFREELLSRKYPNYMPN
jgi:hypothetical protein